MSLEGRSLQPDENPFWDPGGPSLRPNQHLCRIIISAITAMDTETDESPFSRSELDLHANMVVVGNNSFVIEDTGKKADVNPFSPDFDALTKVPIVHAGLLYECPHTGTEHLLLVKDALYVPSMKHNLIPPFILREAGLTVNDTPKIHVQDPTVDDHSILFPIQEFRIPLQLWGVFSYFHTGKPSLEQVQECEHVHLMTPEWQWNPHDATYSSNEAAMLDWEGNMRIPQDRQQILLEHVDSDEQLSAAMTIAGAEEALIDDIFDQIEPDLAEFDDSMLERAATSRFCMSVGATVAHAGQLVDDDEPEDASADIRSEGLVDDDADDDDVLSTIRTNPQDFDEIIDSDMFFASAAHARPRKVVDVNHLSKIWRIDVETAKRTLDTTSQLLQHRTTHTTRNFGTNDRMLRYRRIDQHFFMDTFFARKKDGKSSRGHTCCQLFVTDKGFIFVVPMKSKGEVLSAVKEFAKAVGAPNAIISDAAKEQTSADIRKFCNSMGTTLRVLEEHTPWSNKAELYIGLIKEAVRKEMRHTNCPLVFWDYCVEWRARVNNLTARPLFQLHGSTPHQDVFGEEGDISNLCQFGFYDWCYFRDQGTKFPFNKEVLGRVLGPARGTGNEMAQWILKSNGQVVPRRTARPLQVAELHSATEQAK